MKRDEFTAKAAASKAEIRSIRSVPAGRGVIRVDYFKVGRTFFVLDDSDNSEGFHRVVGETKKRSLLNTIAAAA
jgi:hypothetical protein